MSLAGKVAIVTGSSRSIGAAVAKRLAADGASVVVNYSGSADAASDIVSDIQAAAKGKAVAIRADVSTIAGTQQLVADTIKSFGKIDIVVLNAGIMKNKTLDAIEEADYDAHFNVNVRHLCA
jgi:3-oxoacyl-[acyl-carrier protein] reductase